MRRIGIDENGLGAQMGPLIVTSVEAEVTSKTRLFTSGPPTVLKSDLDDSKALVSCRNISLGEAWARVLLERCGYPSARTPQQLLGQLLLSPEPVLRQRCPTQNESQCWSATEEEFSAAEEIQSRLRKHLNLLEKRGLRIVGVRSEVTCSQHLSELRREGVHRFAADLHAMERLLLAAKVGEEPFLAICGKVGGIGKYGSFFSLLGEHPYSTLEEGRAQSCYEFPGLGEVRFVRDADATDPLVMLASLVGKYVRELFMRRISRFYPVSSDVPAPSGYHDPVTARFIESTKGTRKRLKVHAECFLRGRDEVPVSAKDAGPQKKRRRQASPTQGELF